MSYEHYRTARPHRRPGQPADPRRDDVRRLGQPRPRRLDPDHPPRARRRHQLHRHRRRLLPRRVRGDRRQGARRAAATTSCWPPSSTARCPTRTPTRRATRAAGSSARSRTRCAGSAPTTSTSTRCTGPRPEIDIDETLGALTDLVHAGKVRYIGTSTFLPSQIVEAQWVAETRHRERPVTEQPPYSILAREVERDVLPTAQKYGLGVLPWSPLAGGWLSGRYRRGEEPRARRAGCAPARAARPVARRRTPPSSRPSTELQELADEAGVSLIHLALASCSSTRRSRRRSSGRARSSSSSRSSARRR